MPDCAVQLSWWHVFGDFEVVKPHNQGQQYGHLLRLMCRKLKIHNKPSHRGMSEVLNGMWGLSKVWVVAPTSCRDIIGTARGPISSQAGMLIETALMVDDNIPLNCTP